MKRHEDTNFVSGLHGNRGYDPSPTPPAEGEASPRLPLSDCPEIFGDELDQLVSWKDGARVDRLSAKVLFSAVNEAVPSWQGPLCGCGGSEIELEAQLNLS